MLDQTFKLRHVGRHCIPRCLAADPVVMMSMAKLQYPLVAMKSPHPARVFSAHFFPCVTSSSRMARSRRSRPPERCSGTFSATPARRRRSAATRHDAEQKRRREPAFRTAKRPSTAVTTNRPHTTQVNPVRRGPSEALRIGVLSATGRFFHAERLARGDDDAGVVEQSVEQADRRGLLGEEASPLLEGPV
jgi:hypothetical protein